MTTYTHTCPRCLETFWVTGSDPAALLADWSCPCGEAVA